MKRFTCLIWCIINIIGFLSSIIFFIPPYDFGLDHPIIASVILGIIFVMINAIGFAVNYSDYKRLEYDRK